MASDPPGFTIDEPYETMGSKLMLPNDIEVHREKIERVLTPFEVRTID